jgi:hypothetical protein
MPNVTVEIHETGAVVEVGTSGPQGAQGAQGPAGSGGDQLTLSTYAGLPAAGTNGRLRRVTDNVRGVWLDTGTRWVHQMFQWANLQDHPNGDPTGASDVSQALIDLSTVADGLYTPPGTYRIDNAVAINREINFLGSGFGSTVFLLGGNINGLSFNVGQATTRHHLEIGGFAIGTTADRTAGAALRIGAISQSTIRDIFVSNAYGGRPFVGIQVLGGAYQSHWHRIRAAGVASHALHFFQDGLLGSIIDHWFDDQCQFEENVGTGIFVEMAAATGTTNDIEGIYLGACTSSGNNKGVELSVAFNGVIKNVFLRGTILDGNASFGFGQAGAGRIQVVRLEDVWSSNNNGHNIILDQTVEDFVVDGGHNSLSDLSGVLVYGARNGRVQNCSIMSNSRGLGGDYGVFLANNAANVQVQGNRIYNNTTVYGGEYMNGIIVAAGCTDIELLDNVIRTGGPTVRINNLAGAETRMAGNRRDDAEVGHQVDVVATASLPAASAAMDGRVLIEDAGAGDRNVVIYVAGQRFRLDGGTAF